MTKKIGAKLKAPTPPPSPEVVAAAARTSEIKNLVRLGRVFTRAGVKGPFEVEIPLFCPMWIPEKDAFRRGNVQQGTMVQTDLISVGKRAGLIFRLTVESDLKREGMKVAYIEVSWDDIVSTMPALHQALLNVLDEPDFVPMLDATIKDKIAANPAMHAIIVEGLTKALAEAKEDVNDEALESNELWGSF